MRRGSWEEYSQVPIFLQLEWHSCYPPWNQKRDGLESSDQRLISLYSKTNKNIFKFCMLHFQQEKKFTLLFFYMLIFLTFRFSLKFWRKKKSKLKKENKCCSRYVWEFWGVIFGYFFLLLLCLFLKVILNIIRVTTVQKKLSKIWQTA